jgi:hypothetical protein
MFVWRIVGQIDVVENLLLRISSVPVSFAADAFASQAVEEACHSSVVMTVYLAAYAVVKIL